MLWSFLTNASYDFIVYPQGSPGVGFGVSVGWVCSATAAVGVGVGFSFGFSFFLENVWISRAHSMINAAPHTTTSPTETAFC